MATMNLNIRTDKMVKEQAEAIFAELGINMTTAINMFLRRAIRERGIPFDLKLEVPNAITLAALEEGRLLVADSAAPRYKTMAELKDALDDEV